MKKIGKYNIIEVIGSGSMGEVLKGEDPNLGRFVAIKTLFPQLVARKEMRDRFLLEARALAELRHPNIVDIYDMGEAENAPYIVMEFLDGSDLKYFIDMRFQFTIPQIINILMQTASGMDYAHKRKIIHRDIKPANIFLLKKGNLKIVDFGLARLAESSGLTRTGTTMGTPAYMSPEQARGDKVDARTDQFSLGVIAYELLRGKNPFRAGNYSGMILRIINHDPSHLNAYIPASLEELGKAVMRTLEKDREKRFSSVPKFTKICFNLLKKYPRQEYQLHSIFQQIVDSGTTPPDNLQYAKEAVARRLMEEAWDHLDSDKIDLAQRKLQKAIDLHAPACAHEISQLKDRLQSHQRRRLSAKTSPPDDAGKKEKRPEEDGTERISNKESVSQIISVKNLDQEKQQPDAKSRTQPPQQIEKKEEHIEDDQAAEQPQRIFSNNHGMSFIFIPPGHFNMGYKYGGSDEKPLHDVLISEGFYMQTTPMTQGQWKSVTGETTSEFQGDFLPVENVSWLAVQDFIKKLNAEGNVMYSLLSEAEWEYACRAGSTTIYYWGDEMDGRYCWHDENSKEQTQPVGTRKPNEWGLYDMLGNVWEWCNDWYDHTYYKRSPGSDPPGPRLGDLKVVRGGSYFGSAYICRSANRGGYKTSHRSDNLGFRLVIVARKNR